MVVHLDTQRNTLSSEFSLFSRCPPAKFNHFTTCTMLWHRNILISLCVHFLKRFYTKCAVAGKERESEGVCSLVLHFASYGKEMKTDKRWIRMRWAKQTTWILMKMKQSNKHNKKNRRTKPHSETIGFLLFCVVPWFSFNTHIVD